jgi:predicted ATP-dependent endonuclease of OLD family
VDILNIESENEISKVEIYSVSGSLVKSVTTHSITNIAVADLAKGVYLVITTDASGKQQIIKINKN